MYTYIYIYIYIYIIYIVDIIVRSHWRMQSADRPVLGKQENSKG
jgi:hypothetical protein